MPYFSRGSSSGGVEIRRGRVNSCDARRSRTWVSLFGLSCTRVLNSCQDVTGRWSSARMTSPGRSPASSAGEPERTSPTIAGSRRKASSSTPTTNCPQVIRTARTRFIPAPITRMVNRTGFERERNSSPVPASPSSGFSPSIFTYPPRGSADTR